MNKYIDRRPFNDLSSRTTRVSRHQKGKNILDFDESIYDGVAVASAGPYTNHLHLTPQSDNYASISSLNFYRPDALLQGPITSLARTLFCVGPYAAVMGVW